MSITLFNKLFRRWSNAGQLASSAEFMRLVELERSRAGRSGLRFVIATFRAQRGFERESVDHLASVLQWRLRGTDSAGLLSDGRVALLLPDTQEAGVIRIIDDIRAGWPESVPWPDVLIETFPRENGDIEILSDAQSIGMHDESVELLLAKRLPPWKRGIDVAGAGLGIFLLSPLLAAIAIAIRLTSPGPIVFRQLRSGRAGRPFWLYKFRSMVIDAEQRKQALLQQNEQDGPAFKMERDPRVTRIGAILRATSLDELPQLWNVLKGDMSLVGPRPLPCGEAAQCETWQRQRLDVTPGLTCIWQVKERRTRISFADWVRMDLRYIRKRSPGLDFKLILQTLRFVIRRKGV